MTLQTNDALVPDDGTRFRLRPIDPSDYGGVSALYAGLSPESRDQRFPSPNSELSPHDLSYPTDLDPATHTVQRAFTNGVATLTANNPVGEPPARALLRSLRFGVHASNCHQIEHVLKLSRGAQPSSPPTERKPT